MFDNIYFGISNALRIPQWLYFLISLICGCSICWAVIVSFECIYSVEFDVALLELRIYFIKNVVIKALAP